MTHKVVPKKALEMQKRLIGSVPKGNTYAGDRKPIKRR